ncbi:MAG: hypothetical protein JZU47_10110 [Prolixibacteraceae bacterium]|nr:hypothetical protein [Prolixibacteraceae bacterium]
MKKEYLGYFAFFVIVLAILCAAFPMVAEVCIFIGFNSLFFIDNSFSISEGIHPLLAWSLIFALLGLFIGLAKSVTIFKLHKKFYLYSFLGIFLFLFLINKCSNPLKYSGTREIREEMLWNNLSKKNSYFICSAYISEFPNGKHITEIEILQEKALWDSASVVKSSKIWNLYCEKFKNSARYAQAMRNYDKILWGEISRVYNKEAFANYLKQFPNGVGSKSAKYRLKNDINSNTQVILPDNNSIETQNQPDLQVDSAKFDDNPVTILGDDVPDNNVPIKNDNVSSAIDVKGEGAKDLVDGYGKLHLAGGIEYEGYIQNGKPNGLGKEIFQDNSVYSGFYINGKRDGEFVFTSSDGIKESRIFKFGQRIGTSNPSTTNNPNSVNNNNGSIKNGYGTQTFPDGTSLSGNYIDGKREGEFIYTGKDGKRESQVFKNGNRIK